MLAQLFKGIDKNEFGIRMIDDVFALFGRAGRVNSDADAARRNRRDIDDRPFGNVSR